MALTKSGFKTKFGLKLGGRETVERGEQKEKRREEEEEERGTKIKGMAGTNLGYEFLYEFPYNCMVISCTQTKGLLGFHHNQRCIEIRVSKTLNGTRKVGNPSSEDGFMVKL